MSASAQTNSKAMKKSGILILLLMLMFSCSKDLQENIFTIEGDTGTPNATVYLYGMDSRYDKADSIACDSIGYFRISIPADTITPLALITPDMRLVPVYAEPMLTARLQRDSTLKSGWSVEGGKTQALHDSISRVLDACDKPNTLHEKIDSFILQNPTSDVNIEIIRRYMTEFPQTDHKAIRSRTGNLSGMLQDHYFFVTLKERTDTKVSNIEHRSFPSFSYTTADSAEVTESTYIRKYTLVTFWASWDAASRERMRMLSDIQDSIDSKSFAILNISLDHDSAAWRDFIIQDSIPGDNVIDSKMFNSPLVKQFCIKSLPHTMLVSPYQRVISYDAGPEGLATRIDSLARRYDKEQERKEKERKKKEKEKKEKEEKERKKKEEKERKEKENRDKNTNKKR